MERSELAHELFHGFLMELMYTGYGGPTVSQYNHVNYVMLPNPSMFVSKLECR